MAQDGGCYICFETHPPLRRMCACNMVVHPECITKFCRINRRTTCSVCNGPFEFRVSRGAWRCADGSSNVLVMLHCYTATAFAVALVVVFAVTTFGTPWHLYFSPYVYMLGGMSLLACGMFQAAYRRAAGRCFPFALERERVVELVVASDV